jgi:hypothetical protein
MTGLRNRLWGLRYNPAWIAWFPNTAVQQRDWNKFSSQRFPLRANDGGCGMHPDEAAIFERLETTKKFGLLSDYLVSWTGRAGRLTAKVTVWGNEGTPEDVVRHYVARLLKDFVSDRQITVAAD